MIVAPSILSSDFMNLKKEIEKLLRQGARWFHVDIMDGLFVKNFTFGSLIVKWIRKYFKNIFIDAHLMVNYPEEFIKYFSGYADAYTFHIEAKRNCDVRSILRKIKTSGMKTGLSIKPETPLDSVKRFLKDTHILLLMGVEPGFSGQKFIPSTREKIISAREFINARKYKTLISVDGGINEKTAPLCIDAGADVIVSGDYVFSRNGYTKLVELGGSHAKNKIAESWKKKH